MKKKKQFQNSESIKKEGCIKKNTILPVTPEFKT